MQSIHGSKTALNTSTIVINIQTVKSSFNSWREFYKNKKNHFRDIYSISITTCLLL